MKLSEELEYRGFVNQTTFKDIKDLDKGPRTFYWGVDPSASSMTIGNLASAMMVRTFIAHGYTPILLVGGATGLIGDPDGKAQERDLKTPEEIAKNKASIISEYKRIFNNIDLKVVDNYDWFKDMGYLEFLRTIGKHVPMRAMLGREFVQARLKEDGAGISYAEFSYSLIQGYDFLHLFEKHDVTLQISGADQWGNCIAGVDLIRRKTGQEAHVWTTPLIINKATGVKFGKSEEGAVWLDPNLTSTFKFYQFWLNVDDEGVEDYLKVYTLLPKTEIEKIVKDFSHDKSKRLAQKTLAYEVTKIVHGEEMANSAVRTTEALFGSINFLELSESEKKMLGKELPTQKAEQDIVSTIVKVGLASSNREARQFVEAGSITINGEKTTLENAKFAQGMNLLKRGKNSFAIIEK